LCAGIPVIVPAGCWLGDQVADENTQYHHRILAEHRQKVVPHAPVTFKPIGSSLPSPARGRISFRGSKSPVAGRLAIPSGATELIVQWHWHGPTEPGQFIRVSLERLANDGKWQRLVQEVVGRRSDHSTAMIHVGSETSEARLVFENAFATGPITISEPHLSFLAVPDAGAAGLPTGSSGLSFAARSEIPRLLREMLAHYEHYRQRARDKSPTSCQRFGPEVTLAELQAPQSESVLNTTSRRAA
jgi:hypothetical protein